ncbi:hypothetical protein T08_9780 [Trichinella sp. T8]|nr:hypothetical protein T08_9780 [Trichinella sp. T8]
MPALNTPATANHGALRFQSITNCAHCGKGDQHDEAESDSWCQVLTILRQLHVQSLRMGYGHVDQHARVHQPLHRELPFQLPLPPTAQVAVQWILVAELVNQHPSFGFADHVTATADLTVAIQRHHSAQRLAQVHFVVGNFRLGERQPAEHFRLFDHPLDHLYMLIFEALAIRIDAQRAIVSTKEKNTTNYFCHFDAI